MIEKLGHSKRIQVMRREWIDEGKPRLYYENENEEPNLTNTTSNDISGEQGTTTTSTEQGQPGPLGDDTITQQPENLVASIFGGGPNAPAFSKSTANDDSLFFTDEEDNAATAPPKPSDAVPEEDDLDALLAEHDAMEAEPSSNPSRSNNATGSGTGTQRPPDDDFEDEMEAMAGMDHPW
jgi:replication fork protection complex subunit Csm3/Swi3